MPGSTSRARVEGSLLIDTSGARTGRANLSLLVDLSAPIGIPGVVGLAERATGVPLAARANHGAATVSTKASATSLRTLRTTRVSRR